MTNPVYRCLDTKTEGNNPINENQFEGHMFDQLSALDKELEKLSDRQIAATLMRTKDFKRYQYAIIGSLLCPGDFEPAEWIPPAELKLLTDSSGVDPRLSETPDVFATLITLQNDRNNQLTSVNRAHATAAGQIVSGGAPDFPVFGGTCSDKHVWLQSSAAADVASNKRRWAQPANRLLIRYEADTTYNSLRRGQGSQRWAAVRYLMESRGISTAGWNRASIPGEQTTQHVYVLEHLFRLAPFQGRLWEIGKRLEQHRIRSLDEYTPELGRTNFEANKSACDELKTLSKNALGNLSQVNAERRQLDGFGTSGVK